MCGRIVESMKILPTKQLCRLSNSKLAIRGFTLTELVVVIVLLTLLVVILRPFLLSAGEASQLASCANNMRQLGAGCNIYAAGNGDYLPVVDWPAGDNPWETEQACRVSAIGSSTIVQGPYGFAPLYFASIVRNPTTFYCPAVETGEYSYSAYAAPGYPWPSIPPGFGAEFGTANPYVRIGYNYYPQSKQTQTLSDEYGIFNVGTLHYGGAITFNPPGGVPNTVDDPIPFKITQVNLNKSMGVDVLSAWANINHYYRGQPYGLNAVFPDGHVSFQPVNGNSKKGSNAPFDPNLWSAANGPGENPDVFRIIMNGFQP